jgi:hypothetical protein
VLSRLRVTFSKLKKYVEEQGGYDLHEEKGEVALSFIPTFPEAQEKGAEDSPPPRVIMHGRLEAGFLTFDVIEIEQDHKVRTKDLETAELAYGTWLEFIEQNY